VRFELISCLGALLSHRSYVAHVHSVLIENVEVYIEKLHQNPNQNPSPGQGLSQSKGKEKDKDGVKRRGEGSGTSSGKASINFYCAIGEIEEVVVVREDFSKRVHQYASSMFSSLLGSNTPSPLKKTDKGERVEKGERGEKGENITSASSKSSAQTSSKGISFRFSGQGQGGDVEKCSPNYSVKSDNETGRYHDISMLNMSDDDAAAAIKENITSILKEKEREKEKEKDKDMISSGKAAFAEIFGLSSRMASSSDIPTGSYPGSSARSPCSSPYDPTQSLRDETSPSDKDAYSEDENSNSFSFWDRDKENEKTIIENNINSYMSLYSQDKDKDNTQDTGDSTPKKRKKKKSPHFGIKYRFQVDSLTVKDLRVHAQELLYPTHGEINDSKTIKLALFTLDKKQLSKTEKAKNSTMNSSIFTSDSTVEKKVEKGIVEGSYADEILNRIIAVIQYEIVAKNKMSLASNLFGAAANHTASAVRVAATTAKRGVADSVIAHNPKELFHMATRVINKTVYSQKVSTSNFPTLLSFLPFLLIFLLPSFPFFFPSSFLSSFCGFSFKYLTTASTFTVTFHALIYFLSLFLLLRNFTVYFSFSIIFFAFGFTYFSVTI
jgi:hypothetical protein